MFILSMLLSFTLILYLYKKRINLGLAVMSGGLLLALAAGITPFEVINIFFFAIIDKGTIELCINVFLIIVLSKMMQDYGVLEKMVFYIDKLFGNPKSLLFIIPSILSSFAVMGSAIVAANVIDSLGESTGISKARRAAINLYMRHAWCFVMPISISLLNASYIAGVPIIELIKVQMPITFACLIAGYFVYISPIKVMKDHQETINRGEIALKTLLYSSPLLICVLLVTWIPFYIALIISCILIYFIKDKNKNFIAVLKGQPQAYYLILTVAGIMVFKDIILNIPDLQQYMKDIIGLGIPFWLVCVILGLGIGYISGSTQVFTAMLYPLLLPLVPPENVIATTMLIYTAGFTAYYISPIHLCQALTNDFFTVSLTDLYREYYLTVPVMFISGLLTYFLII
ncbi:MAG: DUF401 family protein [Candidatus Omnitrophica bacterium]|nr:DUF401 family protein [Candidatus Omnitrophota bacterium]